MKKRYLGTISLILILCVLLSSCNKQGFSSAPKNKNTLNVSLGGITRSLDPAYALSIEDSSLIMHMFEGLFAIGEGGKPVLAQAESYEVDDEGLVYTFKLRDNLTWSNGETLSSEDFAYAWNRVLSLGENTRADLFDIIALNEENSLKIETPDSKTLILYLKQYTPYIEELLCLPAFFPVYKKMIDYDAEKWSTNTEACVVNGAFALSEYVEDSHITIQKNTKFRNASEVKLEKINFIMLNETTAYDSYINGEILFADRIPNLKITEASSRKDYYNKLSSGLYYLIFNKDLEPLKDERVRQALMLAIDRQKLVTDVCKGGSSPAGAIVPPLISSGEGDLSFRDVYEEFIKTSEHEENLEKAKDLLKDANYYDEGKELPKISYQHNLGAEHSLIASSIQEMFSELGASIEIEANQWDINIINAKTQGFQILRSGWMNEWNDAGAILKNFRTGNPFNIIRYSNEEYDDYIDSAFSEKDKEKRAELFYKAEKLLFEENIICPLFYYSDVYMQSEFLHNVLVSPYEYKSFVYAYIKS